MSVSFVRKTPIPNFILESCFVTDASTGLNSCDSAFLFSFIHYLIIK